MGIVETDLENLARSLLARLSYDYGDAEDIDPDVAELFRRGERLLPIQDTVIPDDAKHLARARARILNLEQERDALWRIVGVAQPEVCSYLCPSVWKTGEEQPHSELCKQMRAAIEGGE